MSRKIVGLTGRAGAGKDTGALGLLNQGPNYTMTSMKWTSFSFAEPLKKGAKQLFDLTDKQLYSPRDKEIVDKRWGKSPRQILQWLGTDILREHMGDDFFLKHMKYRIESLPQDKNVVITDCRFDNEAKLVKELGGIVIKIERPEAEGSGTVHSDHVTEKGISPELIDYVVVNDRDIINLKDKINSIVNRHD